MVRSARALLLVSGALALWPAVSIGQPVGLQFHSAIFDPPRDRTIVFGGYSEGQSRVINETWQLTLAGFPEWTLLNPSGNPPPKRAGHTAIYDPVRQQMIVYGGVDSSGNRLSDVWALSLSGTAAWTQLSPTGPSPHARQFHSAIYDPVRDRMLIYGGYDAVSASPFKDAWSLSLGTPTPQWDSIPALGPLPGARYGHVAFYDPIRDRMIVANGGPTATGDTWGLSLTGAPQWNRLVLPEIPPLVRVGQAAVHDPETDRVIAFGGSTLGQPLNEVKQLSMPDPVAWTLLATRGDPPSPRAFLSAVYDSAHRRVVLFGGYPNVTDPLWVLGLDPPYQWSPRDPKIDTPTIDLSLPTVTVGDTVSVQFAVGNVGLVQLHVSDLNLDVPGMRLSTPTLPDLGWTKSVVETLYFAPSGPATRRDSLVIDSNDPATPRQVIGLTIDARGLDYRTRVLGDSARVPLGVSFIVVVTPNPGVRIERAMLHYRIADGASPFDSLAMTPLATDYIASVPATAVTEHGVEYYIGVENSGFSALQPPSGVFTQTVARPTSITASPRSTPALAGHDVEIEVTLQPGAIFQSGELQYRRGGEPAYTTSPLAPDILGRPTATIPAAEVGPTGVEFWVEARALSDTLRFPPDTSFAPIRVRVQDLAEPNPHAGMRYRLLAVPLDFGTGRGLDALLTDQFGPYDPVRWRSYWFDPVAGANVEFSSSTAASFESKPGRAFWLISRDAHRVDTAPVDGISTPTDRDYPIPLEAGWNQFGDPFAFPVLWSDVRRSASVSEPVAFDPALGNVGDYAASPPSVLQPFEGYFIHATQTDTLWVRPISGQIPVPLSLNARAHASSDGWSAALRASTDRASDGSDLLGVRSAADHEFDARAWPKPPPSPGAWVQVAFVGADGHTRRDLRAPGTDGETWEIETRSASSGEQVVFEVVPEAPLRPDWIARLVDREQGTVAEVLPARAAGASQSIASARATTVRNAILSFGPDRAYRLAVVAGTPDYVFRATTKELTAPARLALDQNAPNPFQSATRIRFGLPRDENVSLQIFNVQGQRVATLMDGTLVPAGYHSMVWDGRTASGRVAPSGVYLMRLAAGPEALTRRIVRVQ